VQLGCDLARQGGAVRDQLRARAGKEPRQCLGFCRDRDAASAPVREVPGQFLGITAIRFDLLVGGHRDGRRIDHEVGDAGRGEGAVSHEACKPRLVGRKEPGPWKPPQETLGQTCGLSGNGRRLHHPSLAETGHSIRLLVDIDANVDPFAGRREALLCHGMCLSRGCDSEFLKGFSHFFRHPRPTLER